jgi:DNA invertase Pin-like site-specific DNA recombinase
MKNHVVITSDGWVYVLTPESQYGLGDINVDVDICDLRKKAKTSISKDLIESMQKNGMSITAIAQEIGVSRPTIYNLLKK